MKKEAFFYERLKDNSVHCCLCAHNCKIGLDEYGACGIRKNEEGVLNTFNYADPVALNVDPIEKKPLYHFLPSSVTFSIAAYGCNFQCDFCQNWQISQVSFKDNTPVDTHTGSPLSIVELAQENGCASVAYTYSEPTVFFEYAYDCAQLAHERGLANIFVTNGYMSPQAVSKIVPYLDAANIDLKSFDDEFYRRLCKGRLQPVLDNIRRMKEEGVWVEVTTLLIPGENDSKGELQDIAGFIAGVGVDIPWHISRYHPDYKYHDAPATPPESLNNAVVIGKQAGLKYVYTGNIREGSGTYCSECNSLLIKRDIYSVSEYNINDNKCAACGTVVDGIFL